jgi:Ca2+-transporting ATPase
VVLQDDRFATIGEAVREGRVIFDNIRKFVFYLFSCNLAEVMVLLTAGVMGLPLPLLPLQILWLNLVTDTFPALALAMEPAEPGIMARPPRPPGAGILTRSFLGSLLFFGTLITAASLGVFVWALQGPDPGRANTLAFMTLALAQLFHLGNARSHAPVLRPSRIVANPWALASVPLVLGLQLAAVYWAPLQELLRTVPLSPGDWAVVIPASLVTALVGQAIRGLRPRRDGG